MIASQSLEFMRDEVIPDFPGDCSWVTALANVLGIEYPYVQPMDSRATMMCAALLSKQGELSYEDLLCNIATARQNSNMAAAEYLCRTWIHHTDSALKSLAYCDMGDILIAVQNIDGAEQAYISAIELGDASGRAASALAQIRRACT